MRLKSGVCILGEVCAMSGQLLPVGLTLTDFHLQELESQGVKVIVAGVGSVKVERRIGAEEE